LPNPLLEPIMFEQSLVMIYSRPGFGKTHTAVAMVLAITTGTECFGGKWKAPVPLRALLIDGEMVAPWMQQRLRNAIELCGKAPRRGYLDILTPDLQEGLMPDLGTKEGQDAVKPFTDKADVIVIDNLSSLVRSGKENDADTWH